MINHAKEASNICYLNWLLELHNGLYLGRVRSDPRVVLHMAKKRNRFT